MTRREGREEALGEQGGAFEFAAANGQSENGDVQSAGAEALEKDGGDFFKDAELGLRELARKGREAGRKKVRRDSGDDADVDGAGDRVFLFHNFAFGRFQLAQNRTGVRKESLPQFGEADAAPEAVEKAGTQFVFELENLL